MMTPENTSPSSAFGLLPPEKAAAGKAQPTSSDTRTSHAPPTLARTPNLPALLTGLRRWLVPACLVAVTLGAGAAALAWYLVPAPQYEVRAMVHIASAPEAILGSNAQDTETRFVYFQKTQMTLVKSQVVLDAVVADPEVRSLAAVRGRPSLKDWLLQSIVVDFTQGPEILRISLKGDHAEDLVVLVNSVMRHYLEEFVNTEERRRNDRLQHLEGMLTMHKNSLAEKRGKMAGYVVSLGGPLKNEGGIQDFKLQQFGRIQQRLQEHQAEVERLELKREELRGRAAASPETLVAPLDVDQEVENDPAVRNSRTVLARAEATAASLRSNYKDAFAEEQIRKQGLREEIEKARTELADRLRAARPQIVERLHRAAVADLQNQIARAQLQIDLATKQKKQVADELARAAKDIREVNQEAFQMMLVAREVEEEEKLVGAVVGDIRHLNLQGLAPPRAKPLDQAVVSRLGLDKKALMVSGGAGLGTLALVLLTVGLWEFNQRRVTSVGEVVHGFHLDLVGTLPPMRGPLRRGPGPRGVSKAYTRWTAYIDAYRMLLLRAVGPTGARILLVTSAVPGEGKTSLSSHLALSLARSGKRVLLVDGDLRKPTLHRLFDVAPAPGLAEAICGGLPVRAAVRPSVQPGLWVLPAGELSADAVDSLARGTTRELLRELASDFDLVVVDSAPVLPVADALTLAEHADAVVVSLMHGVSRMPKVSAAIHRLQRIGTPVVGAVVHGTDEDVHGEAYYTPELPEA